MLAFTSLLEFFESYMELYISKGSGNKKEPSRNYAQTWDLCVIVEFQLAP